MESLAQPIADLALILFCAALMSLIFKKLKQPVVLGYIVAGFLAGPYMPYTSTIVDAESIEVWADIGVIFLLFSLGLEFSFKKLLKIGSAPIIAVITSLMSMILIGLMVAHWFGWTRMDGLYLGGMMAMSSTSIIIKAFDDLGIKQQKFTSTVFSVLILEDIIAIVMMLLFGTLGKGGSVDGGKIAFSIMSMVFYLVLWFVLGIYLIPLLLKKTKKLLNNETMLILSLALCFFMVVAASFAGFSAAFGAFVMGSILAETTEGEHIEHLTAPVKNLFGAIFFVSVGMMINPEMLVKYWVPILVITLVVLILRSIVETFAFLLGGINIKESIQCGFSLAQVGEFSFIIATLGVSLGAIEPCIYPIIVSVSVITTFTTPYMIKASAPLANRLEPLIPEKLRRESSRNEQASNTQRTNKPWMNILKESAIIMLIYTVLCITVISICDSVLYPYLQSLLSEIMPGTLNKYGTPDDWAKLSTALIAMFSLLVFIRPLLTKGLFDKRFWKLWNDKQFNRAPLVFIVIIRGLLALLIITATMDVLYHSTSAIITGVLVFGLIYWTMRSKIMRGQAHMEKVFSENLNSKETASKPKYAGDLIEKDIHLSEITLPFDSVWCGQTIKDADWGRKYNVHIASIKRKDGRLNIPSVSTMLLPNDKIQLLGSDENLKNFANCMESKENKVVFDFASGDDDLQMMRVAVPENSVLSGKKLFECGIRENFHCMIVGVDRGSDNVIKPSSDIIVSSGDIILVVGVDKDVKALQQSAMVTKPV